MLGNPDRPIGGLAVRTPPGVELLPLGRDDLTVAVALARELRELQPLGDAGLVRDRYEALINSADTTAYLAVADGPPAGLAVLQFRRRLNYATFEGWLSDLHLRREAAGRSIEDALVQAITAEWRLRGGHRVLASVADQGPRLPEALEKAGFEEGLIDFKMAPVAPLAASVPDGVAIRPLQADDGDAVTRLIAEFGSRRSPVPDRMEAVLRVFAAHVADVATGRAGSMVAELGGATVGVCTVEWQRPFWTADVHAWIPDLVVTEPVRGRGIGRALLSEALRRAADAGAAEVRLESGPQRAASHRLYESAGFVRTGRSWMRRRED